MIKWLVFEDTYSDMIGNVEVYDTTKNEYLGEWEIVVTPTTIKSGSKQKGQPLPPICQDRKLMKTVETMINNYMDGFRRNQTTHKWLDEKPTTI